MPFEHISGQAIWLHAMTYRFKLTEPIPHGLRRIGLEQIEMADAKLASEQDIAAGIHDARRCLKRLRALVRLARPGLDGDSCRAQIERLREIGRLLAGARDLHVMQQTIAKLEAHPEALPNGAARRLRRLVAAGQNGSGGVRPGSDGRRPARQRLKQAKRLFTGTGIENVEFDHLVQGLERSYAKARRAFRHAYREPSDEAVHAWRKAVQLHWRHMQLLSRGWPQVLSARASEAKELSRLLGDDHDLSVLLAFGRERAGRELPQEEFDALDRLCRSRQAELRAEARPRGERLFAETPDNLKERLAAYWSSAQRLGAMAADGAEKPAAKPARPVKRKTRARPSPARSPRTRRPAQSQD